MGTFFFKKSWLRTNVRRLCQRGVRQQRQQQQQQIRKIGTNSSQRVGIKSNKIYWGVAVSGAAFLAFSQQPPSSALWFWSSEVNSEELGKDAAADRKATEAVRKDIQAVLEDEKWDDGSWGPVFVRLAWHASGAWDKRNKSGGSFGGTIRFNKESTHGANAGLFHAIERLEKIKSKYPKLSYGDLYTLAGCVLIEEMGGPQIDWRGGRKDADNDSACPEEGRLPDAAQGQRHIRDVFYRMGFNDQEIVALSGAHALGRCHTSRSGFDGPWTVRKWKGPMQYEDESKQLMMLPSDMALLKDEKFKRHVQTYAKDEDLFFRDFKSAFEKLIHFGV